MGKMSCIHSSELAFPEMMMSLNIEALSIKFLISLKVEDSGNVIAMNMHRPFSHPFLYWRRGHELECFYFSPAN